MSISETRAAFGNEVKRRILLGNFTLMADTYDNYYLGAQRVRRLIVNEFNSIFRQPNCLSGSAGKENGIDVLLCPTAVSIAPLLEDVANMSVAQAYLNDIFTVPASLAGLPACSIPYGSDDEHHLPVGLQLIAQFGMDHLLLDTATILEHASQL